MNKTTTATVTMAHRKQRKCRQNKRKTTSKYNITKAKAEWTPNLTREYVQRIDKRMLGGMILMFISFMIMMIDIFETEEQSIMKYVVNKAEVRVPDYVGCFDQVKSVLNSTTKTHSFCE